MIEKNIRSAVLIKEKAARELPRAALSIDYEIGLPAGIHVLDAVALALEGARGGEGLPAAIRALARHRGAGATKAGSVRRRCNQPWLKIDIGADPVAAAGTDRAGPVGGAPPVAFGVQDAGRAVVHSISLTTGDVVVVDVDLLTGNVPMRTDFGIHSVIGVGDGIVRDGDVIDVLAQLDREGPVRARRPAVIKRVARDGDMIGRDEAVLSSE